jgi:hypothetical protein
VPPQAVHQEGQHPFPQSPEYQAPISGLNAKGISPEHLPSILNILFLYLFFQFLVLLTSPLLFSYPCSYPLHYFSLSLATVHYSPPQLLFLSLLIHSTCLHLQILSFPNLSPYYSSLLQIHHPLTILLYPNNLWYKHPPQQQQKYTQTHTMGTKPSSFHTSSPTQTISPLFTPFLMPPLTITQVSISS